MDSSTLVRVRRLSTATISAGLTALLLTSCGSSPQTADQSGSAPSDRSIADSAPEAGTDHDFSEGGAEGEGSDAVGSDVEIGDRDLVHTATMTVRVDDVPEAAETAKELTRDADGYVASEHLSTPTGGSPEGKLTLRIPGEEYEGALTALADLGDRSDLERSVEDVTEEIADVESRIESAETALESLRGYLEEAENVDDLLRVEREIQDRQASLESFQARLESLRDQTSYSTVRLILRPPSTYVEERPAQDSIGFLGGLERGWYALAGLGRSLAVLVGWLLPFAVVGLVLGAWPLWKWRQKRKDAPKKDARGVRVRRPRRHTTPTPAGGPVHGEVDGERDGSLEGTDDGPGSDAAEADRTGSDENGTDRTRDTGPDS